jgi:RNA polymerase sigma factor (sigma-70 family)
LADDIFQETVFCLLKNMPNFEFDQERGKFRAYLKTIVLRRVADAFRRETKYITQSPTNSDFQDQDYFENLSAGKTEEFEPEMDALWIKSVLSQALRRSYKKVDQLTYKSFCLYVLDGLPVEEVGQKLSIDRKGTIYQQKSRFLGILKKEFAALLEDLGGNDITDMKKNDSIFIKAFEELVKNRPEYRETIISNAPPHNLLERIEFARETLRLCPPPRENGAFLLHCSKNKAKKEWIKLENELTIGRTADNGLSVDQADVSGLHASLKSKGGRDYAIKDENSANGVYINGSKIISETFLRDGDIIQLGADTSLIFISRQ